MSHREKSRTGGRRRISASGGLITAGVLAGVVSVPAIAGPQGEQVVHGTARFERAGNSTTITTSDRAIINYDSFNLNRNESVRFIQPGSESRVLNRIQSAMPTSIDGSIFANGNVYFVNRAGIYFGPNAVVNVGGIYAAAGSITNQDFLNNVNRFTDLSGEVVNRGVINASREAHLVGQRVANFGRVVAPDGMITMAAGDDVLLGEQGGKVFARISGSVGSAGDRGVENHGVIDAGSGQVIAGVGDHFALALYDTSVIRGGSVRVAGGENSTVRVRGEIDASNAVGKGGSIDVLGGRIGLYGADLDASGATGGGEIHVGGDYQGVGDRLRSSVTLVDGATTLSANAGTQGDAGRIIVWSDQATVFRGDINAKGPRKGGFAEVSSLGFLDFNGSFDLSGALRNGSLLLDPKDIIITATDVGGATDIGDVDDFAVDPGAITTLHDELLASWLNGGVSGDVILKANNDIQFAELAEVIQNAGETNSLQLFAGRRIVFGAGSVLELGGGSLLAVANAVNEVGFVASERDPGQGSIVFSSGSRVSVLDPSQNVELRVDAGAGTPGSVIMLGELNAPSILISATDAASQVIFGEDGDGATPQIGLGADLTVNAGNRITFLQNASPWSFASLDAEAPLVVFDGVSTGITASSGSLRFAGGTLRLDSSGLFTFSGPVTLTSNVQANAGVLFDASLALGSDIAAAGMEFQDGVTLTDDVTLTLGGPGDVLFGSTIEGTTPAGQDLTLELAGQGGATFNGQVGTFFSSVGDLTINGLDSALVFSDFVFANSLIAASGAGTVTLGNGDDFYLLTGANAAGEALRIDAASVLLQGNILAQAGLVTIDAPMTVNGLFSIGSLGALGADGTIRVGSVLLDASGGDATLTLNGFSGDGVFVATGAGESVVRDTGGLNAASLRIVGGGGDVSLGAVTSNGAPDNFLTLLDIQAAGGAVSYIADRYAARTMTLLADTHALADADSIFGDESGVSSVVGSASFLGGNVVVASGRLLEMNALAAGGDVSVFGARAAGSGSRLTLRAADLATLGTGDTLGDGAQPFSRINVVSGDVALANGLFADSVLLDPLNDVINVGAAGAGMSLEAADINSLNAGAIGTLFLGIDDPAAFAGYAGSANLFDAALTGVNRLDVFGTTSVTGAFIALDTNLYGPVTMADSASITTAGSDMRFFSGLTVGQNTILSANNGLIAFVNADPATAGQEVAASVEAAAGGGSLTLDAGPNGVITLADIGTAANLDTVAATGGRIDFRGERYAVVDQTYTSDLFNIRHDAPGTAGNTVAFAGQGAGLTAQTLTFNDLGGGNNATIRIADGLTVNMALSGAMVSQARIQGFNDGVAGSVFGGAADQLLQIDAGSIQLDRGVGTNALATRLGSVQLSSGSISVGDVFSTVNQIYTVDNGAGTLTLTGNTYRVSNGGAITVSGFGGDSMVLSPAAGGVSLETIGGTINLSMPTITGGATPFIVNAGNAGVINFNSGISVAAGVQSYLGGTMNFLGDAAVSSAADNATISFLGGTVNLGGGNLSVGTTGANAGVNFANAQIVLAGGDLLASAVGSNGGVVLTDVVGSGSESITLRVNGGAVLSGVSGGVSLLDIQANTLAANGLTLANTVNLTTFGNDASRNISVGDDASLVPGTLNISNATLANLAAFGGGANALNIGNNAYGGQILIGDAMVARDVAFVSGGGLVRVAASGLMATGGLDSIVMTAPEIRLGGAIRSAGGLFDLALNGPVNVTGVADVDTNGGSVVFGDAINGLAAGGGFLDVNTAGGAITLREDLGVIGAARSLGRLSLVGAPSLRLTGASTTGDQFFQGGQIVLLNGASFSAGDGGAIAFASPAVALGDASAVTGSNGSVAFAGLLDGVGAANQTVTLTTGTGGTVSLSQVGGPAGLGSLSINAGTVNLNGDLSLLANLDLAAQQTLLRADRIISAQSITLASDIDADGGSASLTLEDAIDTLIQGRLGGNAALASFTSSDAGATTLSGGVFTDGLALFRNAVLVAGNATVQSFGANADSGIRFLGTIDGSNAGADSLTLIVDRSLGELLDGPTPGTGIADPNMPVIALFDSIGSNTALGTLGLNFGLDVNGSQVDGRDFVPANATIVLGDSGAFLANGQTTDITINADNLLMGFREKMAVLGSLNASGVNARLGDISTVDDMLVDFASVTVLLREAGRVLDPSNNLFALDSGTDFVSGGDLQFGNIVGLLGSGADPEFALPGGDPTLTQVGANAFLFKSLDTPVSDLIVSGSTVLDVRADGPTNTNISEALAGAVPQEQQAEPVVTDVPLSQVALDALVDLGIIIKQPADNLYLIDLPDDIAGAADTARVSRRRLEPTLVGTLVADYDQALKEAAPADETAQGEAEAQVASVIRRDAEIKAILDDAWSSFEDERGEDGSAADFFAYTQANAERFGDAILEIERLREVVSSARVLGLTEREVGAVKTKMFTMMQPQMGPRVFRDLVDATPAMLMGIR